MACTPQVGGRGPTQSHEPRNTLDPQVMWWKSPDLCDTTKFPRSKMKSTGTVVGEGQSRWLQPVKSTKVPPSFSLSSPSLGPSPVRTPGSSNPHIYSAFMAPPPWWSNSKNPEWGINLRTGKSIVDRWVSDPTPPPLHCFVPTLPHFIGMTGAAQGASARPPPQQMPARRPGRMSSGRALPLDVSTIIEV